ncbi:EXS-domain-containing protein [Daldinia vernicosa]|uniref:EXS-domain-containing protein n=1 Tax=Daldinia vernicosa TaxID=114800 RepID=UPI002007956E|nr:EXS-domain-containing protein [Daldinia vernicosa]KAI0852655.1 EXS-domain-containing protein [Daldinia vernicosa]
MDGDPAVEPELDSFSLTFPLPYRVAFIIVLAVWAWGINLHYLYLSGIDVPSLIRYPGRSSPHHPTHHLSTYRLATVLSAVFAFALLVFWAFTHRDPDLVLAWDWLPLLYLAVLIGILVFAPFFKSLSHGGRARLRATLRRISVGGLAEAKDGKFGDILLADVLTSYAKVFADLYVALCMLFRSEGSATARPDRGCGGTFMVPLVMAVPSLIRLRQCLIEYGRVRRGRITESTGWGGQHLANALKYFTAFPVIIFSTLQRNSTGGQPPPIGYYRAWIVACVVNSLYSFYWDVAKDWDLTLFDAKARNAPDLTAFGLRRRLHVGPPALYYAVIAMDLVLRCTWSLKLSPHLGRMADWEGSIFVIELLEVFRRWVWIFFRVETEWIRNTNVAGPGVDDVLLPDYHNNNIQGPRYQDDD